MRAFTFSLALLLALTIPTFTWADPTRVFPPGTPPRDARLGSLRTLRNTDFDFKVPATLQDWKARRKALREQMKVALGLWPTPPRTPLRPTIHGKIKREGYTVEKVFFASLPGHYVTGNLYRPTGKKGKLPGVLCPHGHWANGRFYDGGAGKAEEQIKKKAEKTIAGARYPIQARCAQLARMGCVVFHYDMVGYADSQAIRHRTGFTDVQAALWMQNFMGLQTWNSIRALDFLLSLPEVDSKRVGVTGASGGGTQTFILCALDDRPTVAFPAVMVSTQMQGGCICENASYLRQGTGNVEMAALFAPKPLAMSGADDWTIHIERKGLPELKQLYKLYGAEDHVLARCFPQFKHNYNQVSREVMYNWFNKHLRLGQPAPVEEKPFTPIPPVELSVFTKQHPRPKDVVNAERLRQYLTSVAKTQLRGLRPKDARTLSEFRAIVGTALRVMVHDQFPGSEEVTSREVGKTQKQGDVTWQRYLLGRARQGEQVPAVLVQGKKFDGTVIVWVHPKGKSSLAAIDKLIPAARKVLDAGASILAFDAFGTGELQHTMNVDKRYCGYTFGYNRPMLAQRVHDILTVVAFAKGKKGTKKVHLLGLDSAGVWTALARGIIQRAGGTNVARTCVDLNRFRFELIRSTADERMLPGALKYGGLPALTALAAPGELLVHNARGTGADRWLKPTYQAAGASKRYRSLDEKLSVEKMVEFVLAGDNGR